jgi:hypothetical protein
MEYEHRMLPHTQGSTPRQADPRQGCYSHECNMNMSEPRLGQASCPRCSPIA